MGHSSSGSSTCVRRLGTCLNVSALGNEVARNLGVLLRVAQRPNCRSREQSLALLDHLSHE